MNILDPELPFVWPEPATLEKMCVYQHQPPFDELALGARSMFGIVSALTAQGIDVLEKWLRINSVLEACLIVMVYPTCATRQADLCRLLDIVKRNAARLSVRLRPLERVTDRATNILGFLAPDSDAVQLVMGPSEDFGLAPRQYGHVNFAFRADPVLVESERSYFDWLWSNSREITANGVTLIPDLVLPKGNEEGARLWQAYLNDYARAQCSADLPHVVVQGNLAADDDPASLAVVHVDPAPEDDPASLADATKLKSPTERLGLNKLDKLAESMARLYEKGMLVSIDKLSRIPPLDAPLDPKLFGDVAELHSGNVSRNVSMRISIIDKTTLREIEKCRQGLRTLLTRFTFGLADNMRWMPLTARKLFESELNSVNEDGKTLISNLLTVGVEAFINGRRSILQNDINAMYLALGRQGQVTDDVMNLVVASLTTRLSKAKSDDFIPKLSYSTLSFSTTINALISPWAQAFSLLADIVAFPRKALTDKYFFNGLKVDEDALIEVMNVADDVLCQDLRARGIKTRCKEELDLLSIIEKASLESKDRCELAWRILSGDPIEAIKEMLDKKGNHCEEKTH